MTHSLDGAFRRLDHAITHFQLLNGKADAFIKTKKASGKELWSIGKEFDAQKSAFRLFVKETMDVPAEEWGLIASDGIHQLRSALDNLAWALVAASPSGIPRDERAQKRIYFPIFKTHTAFMSEINTRLPGVPDYQRAIIERVQPYKPWTNPNHPLRILHDLSIEDKHRTLPVVMYRNSELSLRIPKGECVDCIVTGVELAKSDGRLDLNADIGRVFVTLTGPNPYVHVYCNATAYPSFENGVRVFEVDSFAQTMIRELLNEFRGIIP